MLGKTNGGGGGFDPSEIQSGTIAVDNILGLDTLGSIVKGNLAGQYVRVIPTPASTTLTDELIEVFKGGVFVNGTFLGMKNPVFFPCAQKSSDLMGCVVALTGYEGSEGNTTGFRVYKINSSKVISAASNVLQIVSQNGGVDIFGKASFQGILNIDGKNFPAYPTTNTTPKVLQIASNGGSLSWGDVPSPAVVAYEGTSLLPTDVVFEDWTLHRAIKDGNVLWVVVTGQITNNGANTSVEDIMEVTLPSEISAKIYRSNGVTCDQAPAGSSAILSFYDMFNATSVKFLMNSYEANKIKIKLASAQTFVIGATQMLNIRIPIFLNTGTVS